MPRKKLTRPIRTFRFTLQEVPVCNAEGVVFAPVTTKRVEKYLHISDEFLRYANAELIDSLGDNSIEFPREMFKTLLTVKKRKEATMPGATKPGET